MRDGVLVMACPVCQEFGRIGSLELRQINAREAVYVCSNSQVRLLVSSACPYFDVSLSVCGAVLLSSWFHCGGGAESSP